MISLDLFLPFCTDEREERMAILVFLPFFWSFLGVMFFLKCFSICFWVGGSELGVRRKGREGEEGVCVCI